MDGITLLDIQASIDCLWKAIRQEAAVYCYFIAGSSRLIRLIHEAHPENAQIKKPRKGALLFGGSSGIRTPDQEIKSLLLYQLS